MQDRILHLRAERDENVCREPFTPEEFVAVGEEILAAMKVEEEAKARQRAGGGDKKSPEAKETAKQDRVGRTSPNPIQAFACPKCSEPFAEPVWHCDNCDHHEQMHVDLCQNCYDGKRPEAKEKSVRKTFPNRFQDESARTSAIAAEAAGMSHMTYEKAKAVVDAAAAEPEKYRPLVDGLWQFCATPPLVRGIIELGPKIDRSRNVSVAIRCSESFVQRNQNAVDDLKLIHWPERKKHFRWDETAIKRCRKGRIKLTDEAPLAH